MVQIVGVKRGTRLAVAASLISLAALVTGCGIGPFAQSASTPTARVVSARPTATAKPRPTVNPGVAALRSYSRQIFPKLNRSILIFDHAARDTANAGGRLTDVCTYYATRVDFLEGQADGVPHPYMWYTPVGLLHHRILGVYHDMRGALQGCEDIYTNGGDVSTSLSDISTAAQEMHSLASDVWAILHPRH